MLFPLLLALLNVGGLLSIEVMGDNGRLLGGLAFLFKTGKGIRCGFTTTLLADPAGVVTFTIDLVLQIGVLKLAT